MEHTHPPTPPTAVLYRRALDLLIKHRPSRELFPIVVSQVPCANSCSEAIVFFWAGSMFLIAPLCPTRRTVATNPPKTPSSSTSQKALSWSR